jgi:hypothetical protein
MLVRGLTPIVELWKVFLCYWVVNLRRWYRGCWHPIIRWLMTTKKVALQVSPLWHGICFTWCKVQIRLV